ncbi:MAG TPA: DUF6132 family protein [Catalimonadaceae bacterium]|nr:DUF6132 family protein [Catalimonadaceae bacterium]
MNQLQKHGMTILGIVLGAIAGYAWFRFVGCSTGSCPITSNPWTSSIYGGVMGGLSFTSLVNKNEMKQS